MIHLPMPVAGTDPEVIEVCESEICEELTHSRTLHDELEKGLRVNLRKRIEAYLRCRGNPQAIGPTPFPRSQNGNTLGIGDRLFDRYQSGTKTDGPIVKNIPRPAPSVCPYCALYMPAKPRSRSPDRDHILPRSVFPEFALLRINLVHVCDDCNYEKGAKCIDGAGNWMFVHPYFDAFLKDRLITVMFGEENRSPVPSFEISEHCPAAERARLQRHVDTLAVFGRYADAPLREFYNHLETARSNAANGTPLLQIRDNFERLANRVLSSNPNDPLGCMFKALAADERLGEFVQARL